MGCRSCGSRIFRRSARRWGGSRGRRGMGMRRLDCRVGLAPRGSPAVFADHRLVGNAQMRFNSLFDQPRLGGVVEAAQEFQFSAVGEGGEEIVGPGYGVVVTGRAALFAVNLPDAG